MKRKLILSISVISITSILVGCGNNDIKNLESIPASSVESEVQTMNLSKSDTESIIYEKVSDRTLLDLTALDSVPEEYRNSVYRFMNNVNDKLEGVKTSSDITESEKDNTIPDSFTNYLLFEFEKTPYTWKKARMEIKGMDSSSQSIIVDVTYNTTGEKKPVKIDSFIIEGEPDYSTKMEVRFKRWLKVLEAKYAKRTNLDYDQLYKDFEQNYGDPQEILESQRGKTLLDGVEKDGKLFTYSSQVEPSASQIGATMTVRYVLVPKYAMGVNLGLQCKHMYITDYALASDPTENMTVLTGESNATVNEHVDKLLYSYYTAIDENNHSGLYSLTKDYQKWDKYYSDMFDTSYTKTAGYTITLFDINGTEVTCGVTRSRKIRAKGSEMTYPTYTERYLYKLQLVGDKLKVIDETLLSSKLTGEPAIITQDAETTGFKSQVSLTPEDKTSIENLIGQLGVLQINKDTSSENFGNTIDLSIPNSSLTDLKTALTSVDSPTKKAVWLNSYLQGYQNYASVSTRELYQKQNGEVLEAQGLVDLIYKGNKWYVYDYRIHSINALSTKTLSTKNAMFVIGTDGIEEYNTQVQSSENKNTDITSKENTDNTNIENAENTENKSNK